MASIERTAYPRFQKRMSAEELRARYELTDTEQQFVSANANGGRQRLTLACLLKTRQRSIRLSRQRKHGDCSSGSTSITRPSMAVGSSA